MALTRTAVLLADKPLGLLRLLEVVAPASPPTDHVRIYAKADHNVYAKDSTGTETQLSGGGDAGVNLFIQDDPPVTDLDTYQWWETSGDDLVTLWVETG